MNSIDIVKTLKNHKGQHIQACWRRQAKTRKGVSGIEKQTCAYVRSGIDYANLGVVKQGIASGERGDVQPLPWGNWLEFPFLIEHKGEHYVRLYPASFQNLKPSVQWFRDGNPVELADIKESLLASEYTTYSDNEPVCFTIRANDVVFIGSERDGVTGEVIA